MKGPKLNLPRGPSTRTLHPSENVLVTKPEKSPRRVMNNVVEGEVTFVGRGNPDPAKYYIVPQHFDIAEFARTFVENKDITNPQVIISVTGGAQDFKMLSSNMEKIFNRGLLRAAHNTSAWIVTGGLSTGVMELVGNSMHQMDVKVPCIGVATYNKVSHKDLLENGGNVNYSAEKRNDARSASLQQDHTHFILVRSEVDDWGQEIGFRSALEHHFSRREASIPIVLVAVNGGPNTIKTLVEGAKNGFPIIIVDQSGRACDAMASYIKHHDDNRLHKRDIWDQLINSTKEKIKQDEYTADMQELCRFRNRITIFNPSENSAEDMDKVILRSIMQESTNFYNKMELAVQWDRADMIEELLQREDSVTTTTQKKDAINRSLQKALLLNRPEIYELLIKKGADKDSINLVELYNLQGITFHVERLKPFAGITARGRAPSVTEKTPLLETSMTTLNRPPGFDESMDTARKVLHSINAIYSKLLDDKIVTFTDALVWAIVVDRPELAKAIWRNMEYPIHAALLACHLYSVLAEWFQGEEGYQCNRDWFEAEAIAVLSEADYDHAIPILTWKWQELNEQSGYDALQIAELGNCKEFTSHPYVQRYLNKKLYADARGNIQPGTPMWKILLLVMLPFMNVILGTYEHDKENDRTRFYHFYHLPIVKIVTCTVYYIFFLILVTVNVLECKPEKYDIEWYEIFLWIWIFASMIEEGAQYLEDRANYFDALSNQMDLFMHLGLTAYIVLRLMAWQLRENAYVEAYTDVLLVSNIVCYARLMNVFAVSKSLGPLFFVIIRLFKDVLQWSFIFVVFMVSFQIGIFALTRQSHHDPWERYPSGTMGVGFSTIIGQQGDNTMEYMQKTEIGVTLLTIYALISQVMLVNLLIAMMGDTYSTVKANSDKEWKFYRYGLITEFISTSAYPPPLNLVFGPIVYLKHLISPRKVKYEKQYTKTIVRMKIAKDKTIEKEIIKERNSLEALSAFVRESTRLAANHSDCDRLLMEYNMKSLHERVQEGNDKVTKMQETINAQQLIIEQLVGSLRSQERALESLHSKFGNLGRHLKVDL